MAKTKEVVPPESLEFFLEKHIVALREIIEAGFNKLAATLQEMGQPTHSSPSGLASYFPMAPPADVVPETQDIAPGPPPSIELTLDDVRESLNAYTRVHGLAEASKVVQSLGVKRLTELPKERYVEAIEALR